MNKITRKAIPAIAMLMVAILSLTGVTYAWFTSNNTVSVSDINVNVAASAGGISISDKIDGTYGKTLDVSTTWTTGKSYAPVSSDGVLSGSDHAKVLSFYTGTISESDSTKLSKSETASAGFVKQELWFESLDTGSKNIYFNYDATTAQKTLDAMFGENAKSAYNSLRIAFVYHGTKATKDAETWSGSDSIVIIEPGSHVDYWGLSGAFTAEYPIVAKDAKDIDNVYKKVTTGTIAEYNGNGCATKADYQAKKALFTLAQGYTSVTVYIWYEGQDVDCTNAIASMSLKVALSFITPALDLQ